MTEQSIAALYQLRQNQFIETRTIIESEVNKFLESLRAQDESLKQQLGVKEDVTCKDLLPELWADAPNLNTYTTQLNNLLTYIGQVHAICDGLNAEAIACLQPQ